MKLGKGQVFPGKSSNDQPNRFRDSRCFLIIQCKRNYNTSTNLYRSPGQTHASTNTKAAELCWTRLFPRSTPNRFRSRRRFFSLSIPTRSPQSIKPLPNLFLFPASPSHYYFLLCLAARRRLLPPTLLSFSLISFLPRPHSYSRLRSMSTSPRTPASR